jgi:hypothetical protein
MFPVEVSPQHGVVNQSHCWCQLKDGVTASGITDNNIRQGWLML